MKINYLHLIKMLSKFTLYGILAQVCFYSFLLAENTTAQNKSVREVYVNVNNSYNSVEEVFKSIENQTDFEFAYSKRNVLKSKEIRLTSGKRSVDEVLLEVSKEFGLHFKQINNSISVKRVSENEETIEIVIQGITITGRVISSEDNGGLPGVNVLVKGTSQGTVTDVEGNYSLDVPSAESVVSFSSVGYISEEVTVGSKTVIDLTLSPDVTSLEEIVVVGYGTQKKSDLTGAVSTVQGNELASRQTTQVSQALQGTMPGVMVTRGNNAPGSSATIRIRGITTIGDSNPLIIMDGVPIDNIDDVNPNDIENISVLKDAASASIYGSRAAAGVIVVTTKRAKTGQLSLDYNFQYGIEKPTEIPDYVDVQRYLQITNELRWNDNGNNADEYPTYPQDVVDDYYNLNASNPDLYPNTNWVDLIMKESAPRQQHTLSIAGGNEYIRSKATLGWDKIDALYDGRSYQRLTARLNNDATITKRLSASVDLFFKREIDERPSMDPMYNMLIAAPVYAAEWQDGRVAGGKTGNNIYGQVKYGGFINDWDNQIGGRISLDYEIIDGLKLSAVVSPQMGFDKGKNFQKRVPYYSATDPTVYEGTLQWASSTKLTETRNDYNQTTTQFLANYDKSFGSHTLSLLGGYEMYHAFYENMDASRDQYLLDNFPYLNIGPLEFRDNSGSAWENAYNSWFGRVSYNYKEKYFLQGNIRYDGSSRFAEDYRWGAFPSFSAGWVLTEESFLDNTSVLSFLKLRGSYGTLGNERIGNYPYQATIAFSNALFYQGANVAAAQTAAQTQYAIEDITWETTTSYNFGIDANFFDYRLRFSGDIYKKTTSDMLLPLEIPDYIGYDNPDQNTGKMNTTGWEFDLGWTDDINELTYSVSFNLSDFKSVMGDLGGTEFLGDQIKEEGSEFNEWYGYKSEGLFQTQEEVDNSPVTNASVRPGDVKYTDISGPEGIPDGKISPEYDRVLLGGSLPRYMYGGNIKLNYRNFDFSMVVQGVAKRNDRLEGLMVTPLMENWGHVPAILDGDYWSTYNSNEQNTNVRYPRMTRNSLGNNYAMSDYWMFNGSYFRVKNITLGYSLPQVFVEKIGLQKFRIYGSVSDILTLNKYPKGWDPEVSTSGYPITSSFVFGFSIKF